MAAKTKPTFKSLKGKVFGQDGGKAKRAPVKEPSEHAMLRELDKACSRALRRRGLSSRGEPLPGPGPTHGNEFFEEL